MRRLVVQSSVGPTRELLPLSSRAVLALVIRQQIQDTERQEDVVRGSGLDWALGQPVHLTDGEEPATRSTTGEVQAMKVSRRAVGAVLAELATGTARTGTTLTLSGAPVLAPA